MYPWLDISLRAFLHRLHRDERGQDALVWLLVILVLWLIFTGRRVLVQ